MNAFLAAIVAVGTAIGSVFSWLGVKSGLNNTAEMKRVETLKKEQAERDRLNALAQKAKDGDDAAFRKLREGSAE